MSQYTKEQQKLIVETQIKERALIIYVIQSDLMDFVHPKEYRAALKDEIKNHKLAIKEYKQELKKLNK